MLDPDPRTLDAARRGDRDAIAEILALAQPHVWRFIASLERNRETVEDLTQESLLRTVRALPRFRGDSRFRTWTFAIARNVVTDHQRAVQRRPRLVAAEAAPNASVDDPDVSVRVDLERAIDALPTALREVFVLIEVNGLRYREVSDLLDLPEGTVKSRMFHARRELIRRLDFRGVADGGR